MTRTVKFSISKSDYEVLRYCQFAGESDRATFIRALHYLFEKHRKMKRQTVEDEFARLDAVLKDIHF